MYNLTYLRESQPDWLTVGAHRRTSVESMRSLARTASAAEESDGNHPRPWRLLGYEGFRCGRVRWGEARGWGLLQLSGDAASCYLASALEYADSVSRLDLAVTVQTDRPDPDAGRVLYEQARDWRVTHPKAAAAWYIGGDDTGWTTYIGKRESDCFFRCYDKSAESRSAGDESDIRQYAHCWRYELELKGDAAEPTARRIVDANDVPGTVNALVYRWLADRGVAPPWTPGQRISPIGTFRRRSDRDRKLAWLLSQVRPTVQWLVEHGDEQAMLASLGLPFAVSAAATPLLSQAKEGDCGLT